VKIVEGIHQVDGVNGNVYLVEKEDKLILTDTGLPRNDKKILNYIKSLNRKPSDISWIVITHFHIDHVGSLKKMQEATGAKVAVHELDADFVAGTKPAPKPKNLMIKALSSVMKATPVEVDLRLKENDKVGGLVVIHTPGHSDGSISLLDAERKVMFVGDAARFRNGKIEGPPEQFTLDPSKAKDSIGKISTYNFDVMLSGHGEPLMPEASEKLKAFYATLK
jgi:glyoxylase-like metal-dependent hydrolase (beta-lactamase superfamily II)